MKNLHTENSCNEEVKELIFPIYLLVELCALNSISLVTAVVR